MGESVKLTDGKYIDTEGVYDATKGETQSAINNRLGTVIKAGPSAAGSKTMTRYEGYGVCSLTLPNYGKWLVFGSFQTSGAVQLILKNEDDEWKNACCPGLVDTAETKYVLTTTTVLSGGKTVELHVTSLLDNQTITWATDARFWGLKAICIG